MCVRGGRRSIGVKVLQPGAVLGGGLGWEAGACCCSLLLDMWESGSETLALLVSAHCCSPLSVLGRLSEGHICPLWDVAGLLPGSDPPSVSDPSAGSDLLFCWDFRILLFWWDGPSVEGSLL